MSEKINKLINISAQIANKKSARFISSEHILLAIFSLNDSSTQFLSSYVKENELNEKIFSGLGYLRVEGFSKDAEKILSYSKEIQKKFGFKELIPLHIIYAITDFKFSNRAQNVLYQLGVRISSMHNDLESLFVSFSPTKKNKVENNNKEVQSVTGNSNVENNIDKLLFDLTEKAKEGLLNDVIGRDNEIERIIQTLSKSTKNNPILLGDPGVGKTAIIEGLALKIIRKEVPLQLQDKKILSLDVSSLLAGTQYRGQFEERMKNLINYIKSDKNIILFIDEIHMIMGAGATDSSSLDIANMLKPILARSEITVIGATTFNEYRKHIEKDSALERRFMPVKVFELSQPNTIKILDKLKIKLEKYHRLHISQEAIESAVSLSVRYLPDRYLPDKAIDLLDETCSFVSLRANKIYKIEEIENELKNLEVTKLTYKSSFVFKNKIDDINNKIESLKKTLKNYNEAKKAINAQNITVQSEDIKTTIAKWTGINIESINKDNKDKLRDLYSKLSKKLIGQDYAIETIVKSIKRASTGFKDKNRPIGSFLFVGPTGVGKTELAKLLALEMFGSKNDLIRIDMSEYFDKNSVSRLIGASPGYIGYEEGGVLTNLVRNKPFSIILFDEIEKAHPDIFNIFLQILDDGRLTDSQGKVADFKNTIIILTSNLGAKNIQEKNLKYKLDKENIKELYLENLKNYFKPEILNRLDEVIVFNNLDKKDFSKIAYIQINELIKNLQNQGISLKIKIEAFNLIVQKSYSMEYGARELKREIQKTLIDKITDLMLNGDIYNGSVITVDENKNDLIFDVENKY